MSSKLRPHFCAFILLFICNVLITRGQSLESQLRRLDSLAMEVPRYLADSARDYAIASLQLAQQIGSNKDIAKACYRIGMFSNELNDFENAIEHLNQGLAYVTNDTLKAALYTELGRSYDDSSRPDTAIAYILKGLEINEKLGPAYEARSLSKLAFSYRSIMEFETALKYFKLALKKEQEAGLKDRYKRSYMNIGLLLHDMDVHDSAIYYFNKSYALMDSSDVRGIAIYNNNMASSYLKQGDLVSALPFAHKNLKRKLELGDQESLTYAYNILSDIHLQLGEYVKAHDYAKKAMASIDTFPAGNAKVNAYRYLIEAKIMLADTAGTLNLLNDLLAMNRELYENEKARAFALMTTQYDSEKKEYENKQLKNTVLADGITINNQYAIIMAGSVVLILMIALILIVADRSKQNRLAHIQMSEQKEEIQSQRDQLEEMNRTKDRFFGIISHDLRGPVNAFMGLSALTRMYLENGDQEQIPELIDQMDKSSNRLSTLLDNLLNWALTQEGSFPYFPEAFNIGSRMPEVTGIFVSSAKAKGITLLDKTDGGLTVFADPNGFKTIIRNLINNAVKFSNSGDIIEIESEEADNMICIKVSDTGSGMGSEKLTKLFDLEQNESQPGTAGEKGSGLGLVLCKELIELNKGNISVTSELNQGTTFSVSFPKA